LGVGFYLQGYFPFDAHYEDVQLSQEIAGNLTINWVKTPVGSIYSIEKYLPESFTTATEEHYVKTWKDLRVLRYWYEHTDYTPNYAEAAARTELVGENGVVLCYLPKSPLMELVALQAGITAVTFAMIDAPDEFEETIRVLERKADEAAEISLNSPAECLMIPENLSSEVVGKKFFNQYMRAYEERWIPRIKAAGKFSFVHMDGTLKGLIREVASTGFTVLEALTTAPVGDLAVESLRAYVGPKTVTWGGLPGLYFTDLVTDEDFDRYVIATLNKMRSTPGYVLGVADQVPPGTRWERIKRVSLLVEEHGTITW
jgi:Uroporphyrinogen decarboxylase (URO-D)